MTNTTYFSKDAYATMFEDLWEELRSLELADHSIADIEETEVFKYSPYKGLTVDQKVALDKILSTIESGLDTAKPIVVEGMPGTGKTVLVIYLLKMLKDNPAYKDMNIRIIEPVTSLRETLRKSLKNVSGLNPSDIIAPTDLVKPAMGYTEENERNFDIVLVDEAHKLKRALTWVPNSAISIRLLPNWGSWKTPAKWIGSSARRSCQCSSTTPCKVLALRAWG